MATIRKRNRPYQVQIRKDQHSLVTKTFDQLADAKRWASTTEYEIEHGLFKPAPASDFLSIGDLIDHYLLIDEKENLSGSEIYRIRNIQKHLGDVPIGRFKGGHLARYRDLRLKHKKPTTLVRELSLLRRILRITQSDWDVEIPVDPLERFTTKRSTG